MQRITSQHLIDISETIGIEVEELEEALAHLDPAVREQRNQSANLTESTVDMLLNPALLTSHFFSNRAHIPDERHPQKLREFQRTGMLTAKLTLLTIACTATDHHQLIDGYTSELLDEARHVYTYQNPDAELYLLLKIKELMQTRYYNHPSNETGRADISACLNELFTLVITSFWNEANNAKTPSLLASLSRNAIKDRPEAIVTEWVTKFVVEGVICYGVQANDKQRRNALLCLHSGCEPIKDLLDEDEKTILLQIAVDFNQRLSQEPSYASYLKSVIPQFISYLNQHRFVFGMMQIFGYGITKFNNVMCKSICNSNIVSLQMASAFSNATKEELATLSKMQLQLMKKVADFTIRNMARPTLAESLDAAKTLESFLSWITIPSYVFMASSITYGAYQFFKRSTFFRTAEDLKLDTPEWLSTQHEEAAEQPRPGI